MLSLIRVVTLTLLSHFSEVLLLLSDHYIVQIQAVTSAQIYGASKEAYSCETVVLICSQPLSISPAVPCSTF